MWPSTPFYALPGSADTDSLQSRALVSGTQARRWIQQGALPWLGKERDEIVCRLWAGELVLGAQAIVSRNIGQVRLQFAVDSE